MGSDTSDQHVLPTQHAMLPWALQASHAPHSRKLAGTESRNSMGTALALVAVPLNQIGVSAAVTVPSVLLQ